MCLWPEVALRHSKSVLRVIEKLQGTRVLSDFCLGGDIEFFQETATQGSLKLRRPGSKLWATNAQY